MEPHQDEKKKCFDPLSILLINDAYKQIQPERIIASFKAAYPNHSSLSSSISRLRTRLKKIGLPDAFTNAIRLSPTIYRSIRQRSRDKFFNGNGEGAQTQENVEGYVKMECDENTTVQHRGSIQWANMTFGIPSIFECAYSILQHRRLPAWHGGGGPADPGHVYAALHVVTGLGPHELLNPYVSITHGRENTVNPHTGNFEGYWMCVSDLKKSTRFDRPGLFMANRVVKATQWLRRALNLLEPPSPAMILEDDAYDHKKAQVIKRRRLAWGSRALLKTFGRSVSNDNSCDIKGNANVSTRNRNPSHRFTMALYIAAVSANYFEGFKVFETAEYLRIPGDFTGLQIPFTPLVNLLRKSVARTS